MRLGSVANTSIDIETVLNTYFIFIIFNFFLIIIISRLIYIASMVSYIKGGTQAKSILKQAKFRLKRDENGEWRRFHKEESVRYHDEIFTLLSKHCN